MHEHDGDELTLIAKYPYQIAKAQGMLSGWATHKIEVAAGELADAEANLQAATSAGLALAPFERALRAAGQRVAYYRKIKAAVDEGYCIVPNFPIDLIAMRTKKKAPKDVVSYSQGEAANVQTEGQILPAGEGETVSPTALTEQDSEPVTRTNARGEKYEEQRKFYWPTQWRDVLFPFATAKPEILNATTRAMALKVFDQIGVLPARRNQDPLIVGRILDPSSEKTWDGRGNKVRHRYVSFLICWFLDTRDL